MIWNSKRIKNPDNTLQRDSKSRQTTSTFCAANEGQIRLDGLFVNTGPTYQYYRKDHLGNNREVWNAITNQTVQRTHYYPSGLPWNTVTGIGASVQNKKYNGKEFVEMHGLDEYDSEARWFYPAIMRTTTIDPLAEKYYSISPYAWCGNNPVRIIDPTGKSGEDTSGKPSEINKTTGVPTSEQSSVRVPEQPKDKFEPVLYIPPTGEIKDANKENFKRMHNEAMNDPIKKQCLTDPVLQYVSGEILTRGVLSAAKSVAKVTTQMAKEKGLPILYKGAQVALNNPKTTETLVGVGIGYISNKLSGDTQQDVPQITTGIKNIDFANQVMQYSYNTKTFFKYIKSIRSSKQEKPTSTTNP